MNLPSLNQIVKHQMFRQLFAVFLNGHMSVRSLDHYSHDTSWKKDGGDLVASASIQGWFVHVDGNGLLHFPLKEDKEHTDGKHPNLAVMEHTSITSHTYTLDECY